MDLNHVTIFVTDLARSAAFYEKLGLRMIVHAPPGYARFCLPEGSATFSIEVTDAAQEVEVCQALIYLECRALDSVCAVLSRACVEFLQPPTDMPYLWREARLKDPDGHEIRLYAAGVNRLSPPWRLTSDVEEHSKIWILPWSQDRKLLIDLFRMADDSEQQIATYLYVGEVIAAAEHGQPVGLVQVVVRRDDPLEFEIKSIAVIPQWQSRGIGARLVQAAARYSVQNGGTRLTVSTSIAAFKAIRFYLKQGFRVSGFARDCFSADKGYAPYDTSGLPLNDAVEFDLTLT
jgi:ribosomal protein S18 acetylase RimI-like enzyme